MEVLDETVEMPARPKPQPLAVGKLRSQDHDHYFKVFLWKDRADYEVGARPGRLGTTTALCVTDLYTNDAGEWRVKPKLGELHFQSGNWDVNTVSHEVMHATLHRARYVAPFAKAVFDDLAPNFDPENEEIVVREHGDWVEVTIRWLTNTDPESIYSPGTFDR